MLDALFEEVTKYMDRDSTRAAIRDKIVRPALCAAAAELRWVAVAVLVLVLLQLAILAVVLRRAVA
jgi:hypothetical protein